MKLRFPKLAFLAACTALSIASYSSAATLYDQNVTPGVIFGSGNLNGGYTVDTANGVEIGLRGKLRHNAVGAPENTFNSDGDGSYTFYHGVAPTQSYPTAEWSFEWSVNSNVDGSSGYVLGDLTYEMTLDGPGVSPVTFDPITGINPGNSMVLWDHSTGDNSTTDADDDIAGDAATYATLLSTNNVAQNSWKPHWFIPGFNPNLLGDYTISLTAYDGGTAVASSSIIISSVPEPGSIAMIGMAGALGAVVLVRRRKK